MQAGTEIHPSGANAQALPEHEVTRTALVEARMRSRYRWAAQVCGGRRVLDVGCRTGVGSRILAEGGAAAVVGVDDRRAMIEAGAPGSGDGVVLEVADLSRLPYEPGSFDVVVWFDDRGARADRVDELARVLQHDGTLVTGVWHTSAPRGHAEDDGLRAQLTRRFGHVTEFRAREAITVTVSEDGGAVASPPSGAHANALIAGRHGDVLLVASRVPIEPPGPVWEQVDIGSLDVWIAYFDQQERALRHARDRAQALEELTAQRDALRRRLLEAEQELAEARLARSERILELEDTIAELRRTVETIVTSKSWRLTEPLRTARSRIAPGRRR